jgi:hypothetical protein
MTLHRLHVPQPVDPITPPDAPAPEMPPIIDPPAEPTHPVITPPDPQEPPQRARALP